MMIRKKALKDQFQKVRPLQASECGFIIDTWQRVTIAKDTTYNRMSLDTLNVSIRERAMRVLSACPGSVIMSTKNEIVGFCVYSVERDSLWPLIHFLWIHASARKQLPELLGSAGIHKASAPCWVSCIPAFEFLKDQKYCKPHFNPFLLEFDPTVVRGTSCLQ